MIFRNVSSPCRTPQRKKRLSNLERSLNGSAKSIRQDLETIPAEPVPIRYTNNYKQRKAQAEMGNLFQKKKTYPIAPDALIPNSSCRTVFKPTVDKPVEPKIFRIRFDILENLQNKVNHHDEQDDEGWTEIADPDTPTKPPSAKQTKTTLVSRHKETIPELFKRMQNETWWKKAKEDRPNIRSMILYLNEILKAKHIDSYESACYYVVEIFRTYGLESVFINQILDILLDHLQNQSNDRLDIFTIRTIAQFMIERKDIVVRLLEYAMKCSSDDALRLESINSIKFITDINNSDDIESIFDSISIVSDAPEDNFSLKTIIQKLEHTNKIEDNEVVSNNDEKTDLHPLLKKISEERWFPRNISPINVQTVLQAILIKLQNTSKSLVKTLTTHLFAIHQQISYNKDEFDQVANGFIELLGHTDADYRLIAATNLANFGKETKLIDLALLNSFMNDARILVRTECGDSLKKLTGITSDRVLQDCAADLDYLRTLSEENFSLRNYLKEKNRLPTPPPAPSPPPRESEPEPEPPIVSISIEEVSIVSPSEEPSIEPAPSHSSILPTHQTSIIIDELPVPVHPTSRQCSNAPSVSSSMTGIQPSIRVEINGRTNASVSNQSRSRADQSSILTARHRKQSISPTREQLSRKRSSLLPNNTNMWDSYEKQKVLLDPPDNIELSNSDATPTIDPLQAMIDEHKQTVGFFRPNINRRVLVPHKISMENTFSDQSHIMIKQYTQSLARSSIHSMNLSDYYHNQHQLNEVEFIQLLSSLVIRAVQVHRQYENFQFATNIPTFMSALSVQPVHIHPNSKSSNTNFQRPTNKQISRMQTNTQARAAREGINIHKAQHMEGVFSNLLKTNREPTKTTLQSSQLSHVSSTKLVELTHAWLLVQLLKSQGVFYSEIYLQKIISAYPKFIPVLNTKIPSNLISTIWNDQILQKIVSIFTHKHEQLSSEITGIKRSDVKPSEEDYVASSCDHSTAVNRDEQKKKFLPVLRGSKMNIPRHVLKFGFRDVETMDSSDASNNSREEVTCRSKKRRVYMHMMMSSNENVFDRAETIKQQYQHSIKADYNSSSFVPIVTRAPMCH